MKTHYLYYPGKRIELKKEHTYIIGRSKESDIYLPHQSVSRQHALIEWEQKGFLIKDLRSTNGLFMNSRQIDQKQLLEGDRFRIGVYYLEYKIEKRTRKSMDQLSEALKIENNLNEILNEIDNPRISEKLLDLKHYINRQSEKMESLAYVDRLTELYNRRFFDEKLEDEMERARRYKRPLSLVMIDIDHFKKFNDTYGHQKGDEVLKVVGQIISNSLRKNDIPCRYGGEEMVVILPETDSSNAYKIAEKLRQNVAGHAKEIADVDITISLGAGTLRKDHLTSDNLIKNVDQALYRAKAKGRNRTEGI